MLRRLKIRKGLILSVVVYSSMENVVCDVGFQNAGKQNGLHGNQAGRE